MASHLACDMILPLILITLRCSSDSLISSLSCGGRQSHSLMTWPAAAPLATWPAAARFRRAAAASGLSAWVAMLAALLGQAPRSGPAALAARRHPQLHWLRMRGLHQLPALAGVVRLGAISSHRQAPCPWQQGCTQGSGGHEWFLACPAAAECRTECRWPSKLMMRAGHLSPMRPSVQNQ